MPEREFLMNQGDNGPHGFAIREVPAEGTMDAENKVFEAGVGETSPESEPDPEQPTS
jgi:hypothetical protein